MPWSHWDDLLTIHVDQYRGKHNFFVLGNEQRVLKNIFQGSFRECLLNSLDIFTFVVNPMLPPALTANNAFAQKRLQKKGIYCLHTKHINLCGGIDVVAFDKVNL